MSPRVHGQERRHSEAGADVSLPSRSPKHARIVTVFVTMCALLLGGCAATHPRRVPTDAPQTVVAREVAIVVAPNLGTWSLGGKIPAWGITTSTRTGPYLVELDASMPQYGNVCRMVTAHEIGHVLGIDRHDAWCPWMRPSMPRDVGLADAPCEETVIRASARTVGQHFILRLSPTTPPEFVEATRWAVARWNAAIGRNVLSIRVGTAPTTTPQPTTPRGT